MPSRGACSSRRLPLRRPCPRAALASVPLLPAHADLSPLLRQAAGADDEDEAPERSRVVEGYVLGYGAPGRESDEVRGAELALYPPRVVLCHVPGGVFGRHSAPAVDHVYRVVPG